MQPRGDNAGVIKESCLANTNRESRSDLFLRASILRVDTERPGVGIQSTHIVTSGDFEPSDAKGFDGILAAPEVVRDELGIRVIAGVDQRSSTCYEVAVGNVGFCGLTGALKSLCQGIAACGAWKALIALTEQVHRFGIVLAGGLDFGQPFNSGVIPREVLDRGTKEFLSAVDITSGKLQICHLS